MALHIYRNITAPSNAVRCRITKAGVFGIIRAVHKVVGHWFSEIGTGQSGKISFPACPQWRATQIQQLSLMNRNRGSWRVVFVTDLERRPICSIQCYTFRLPTLKVVAQVQAALFVPASPVLLRPSTSQVFCFVGIPLLSSS